MAKRKEAVEGETVLGTGFHIHAGGKGANQAVVVARLGYPVRMIGRLGDDAVGAQLRRCGCCRSRDHAWQLWRAMITVAESGENCIVIIPGANAWFCSAFISEFR